MESRYKRDHGYSYGEMIQKQDALTVSELTEGVFSEWDDKLEIMGSICDFYDYMWRFYPDGRLVLADTILYSKDVKNCEWKGKVDCGHLEYHSLDDMLSDWLDGRIWKRMNLMKLNIIKHFWKKNMHVIKRNPMF